MNYPSNVTQEKGFLEKLFYRFKFKKDILINLPVDRLTYLNYLNSVTYYDRSLDFGTDMIDIFNSNYKEFKGVLYDHGFELKRKRRFFDFGLFYAKANGNIRENGGRVQVSISINSFRSVFYIFYGIAIPIYTLYTFLIILSAIVDDPLVILGLFFLFIHGAIVLLVPFFLLRRSTRYLEEFFLKQKYYLK